VFLSFRNGRETVGTIQSGYVNPEYCGAFSEVNNFEYYIDEQIIVLKYDM
jgi:hypothetical protein